MFFSDRSIAFNDLETNFMSYFPSFMQENVEPEVLDSIEKKLKEAYFGGSPISNENVESFVAVSTCNCQFKQKILFLSQKSYCADLIILIFLSLYIALYYFIAKI